jgi:hypothetical protein
MTYEEFVRNKAGALVDDDDEFIQLLQPLTPAEKDLIPEGLQMVMLRILVGEQGLRLPGNFLARS